MHGAAGARRRGLGTETGHGCNEDDVDYDWLLPEKDVPWSEFTGGDGRGVHLQNDDLPWGEIAGRECYARRPPEGALISYRMAVGPLGIRTKWASDQMGFKTISLRIK